MIKNITNELLPTKPLIPLDLSKVEYIVLHHADAKNCTWKDINAWHKTNGWNCAGYAEFISKDGTVYIMRGDNIGAQCQDWNSKSYGICCEGDFDIDEISQPQFDSLVERIKYNIPRFPCFKDVVKHSKLFNTTCPGDKFPFENVMAWVKHKELNFEESVKELVSAGIINSPEYWLNNAVDGEICDGRYVQKLIISCANEL